MLDAVRHCLSDETQMDVVPRHATSLEDGDLVRDVIVYLLEIHHTTIVVILTWEDCATEVRWVTVGERTMEINDKLTISGRKE